MRIVAGLGNPGEKYERTRHNAGFWVVDTLADRFSVSVFKSRWQALVAECRVGNQKVVLCKPQTFMNLSGESISQICSFYSELDVQTELIVVYDDMDFPLGQIKLRESGGPGGHNGMKSLIQHLGTDAFPRVRFGIGRPDPGRAVIDHVLSSPPSSEWDVVKQAVDKSADAVEFACQHDFTLAMNRFNTLTP